MDNEDELRVVHALRLKSFADTDVVAEAAGLAEDATKQVLEGLAEAERVKYREGRMTGWMLMPDGRAYGELLLAEADANMQPICADLAALFDRFGHYGPKFAEGLAKVQAGEIEWFTKPMIESYHTVWFELHEDLLASLGIDRAKEGHA